MCRQPNLLLDGEPVPVPGDLSFDDAEGYGLEIEEVSAARLAGRPLPFGREDAVNQSRALEALLAA